MQGGKSLQGICQSRHYRMAAELVATDDDRRKQLISCKLKMAFVLALHFCDTIFKTKSKKPNISLSGQVWGEGGWDGNESCVQGRQLFRRAVRLSGNERRSLHESRLLSSGGPSSSLKAVWGTGHLLPHCWSHKTSKNFSREAHY